MFPLNQKSVHMQELNDRAVDYDPNKGLKPIGVTVPDCSSALGVGNASPGLHHPAVTEGGSLLEQVNAPLCASHAPDIP